MVYVKYLICSPYESAEVWSLCLLIWLLPSTLEQFPVWDSAMYGKRSSTED